MKKLNVLVCYHSNPSDTFAHVCHGKVGWAHACLGPLCSSQMDRERGITFSANTAQIEIAGLPSARIISESPAALRGNPGDAPTAAEMLGCCGGPPPHHMKAHRSRNYRGERALNLFM